MSALEQAEGKGATFCTWPRANEASLVSLAQHVYSCGPSYLDSFLNITKAATESELSRAYRKRSLELQSVLAWRVSSLAVTDPAPDSYSPDKNPNDSVSADRFARLGTIAAILRDAEKRKR